MYISRRIHLPRVRRIQLILGLLFITSFSQFHSGVFGWNSISRLALTANLVQYGRLDIGDFEKKTGDKAEYNGKFYSDKAPGMSLLALPVAGLYTAVIPVTPDWSSIEQKPAIRFAIFAYLCTLATSSLLTALAATLLFSYAKDVTGSIWAALIASITYGLGTPAWIWATALYGHAAAGALLFIGFVLADRMAHAKAGEQEPGPSAIALMGLSLGAAVSVEFTAVVPAAIILGYFGIKRLLLGDIQACAVPLLATGTIALLTVLPLLYYNYAIFGTPFHLAYANVPGEMGDGMRTGFFGIFLPDPKVIVEILFGHYRGVFWLSPVLISAVIALIWWVVQPGDRLRSIAIASIAAYYILVNSGYLYWDGGQSTGPRHITPIYAFLALALGVGFAQARPIIRQVIIGLLSLSIFLMLACVSVECCSPEDFSSPLFQLILPRFFEGDLKQTLLHHALGTHGLKQLVPLAITWALLGSMLWRELRKRGYQGTSTVAANQSATAVQ